VGEPDVYPVVGGESRPILGWSDDDELCGWTRAVEAFFMYT
jgi:hypothetical protein